MKKLFLALLLLMPLLAVAKKPVDAKYLKGGIPEENGVIVFRKSFSVPNMEKDQIYNVLNNFVNRIIITPAIHELRTRVTSDGKEDGIIIAKVEEYMTFSHKFLSLDRTRFIYQLQASVEDNNVKLAITQVSYYYNEDQNGNHGTTYKGEEWISDAVAVNKKGTKLYPYSGKFRIKTIDRVEEIFESCMDAFEESANATQNDEPAKKVRKNVIEN